MAHVVLGVGSSHGPSIQTTPDEWARLAERDTRDPRFDYQALLASARPGLEQEITAHVQRARHAAAREGLQELTAKIAQAKLDVVVVVSNPHRIRPAEHHPVFGVFRSDSFPVAKRSGLPFNPDSVFLPEAGLLSREMISQTPGQADLANHLIVSLIHDGFDIACTDELPEGTTLDDAYAFPYDWLFDGASPPVVPFLLSRDLPNQATPRRCYELGVALRRAIESWSVDARVGLIASGGLSHQIIDEDLDQMVIQALVNNDIEALWGLSRDRLNRAPGTPEILNWITVAAAMAPSRMTLVNYLPCYRSAAGTGHGVAFGYWI